MALGCFFLPRGLGSRRDFAGEKRGEGLLLAGHEKVQHGFGLTGDCSSHTPDGAGSLTHGLLLIFLRYGTPDWAQGKGRTFPCASVGVLEDFSILLKTLCHYSKSV